MASSTGNEVQNNTEQLGFSDDKPSKSAIHSEQDKFTSLCSGLETSLANLATTLDDVLILKDSLLHQHLPCNLKVQLTLILGRLYRSVIDLNVPAKELTRLVKLYSVPWENKSKALKKLHQDYESKQHQLEIALRMLEMVGVKTMRMERERRIMNWEKLFAKLVGLKGHGQRWRFVIQSFKQKLAKGDDLTSVYADVSDEDEEQDNESKELLERARSFVGEVGDEMEVINAKGITKEKFQRLNKQLNQSKSRSLSFESQSHSQKTESVIENESEISIRSESSGGSDMDELTDEEGDHDKHLRKKEKRVRFDDDNDKGDDSIANFEVKPVYIPLKVDKGCWTNEPDYDKFFHVKLFRPVCQKVTEPWCSIAFGNQLKKSSIFSLPIETNSKFSPSKGSRSSSTLKGKQLDGVGNSTNNSATDSLKSSQEFVFNLPSAAEANDLLLRIAVHQNGKKSMVAMATINFNDIITVDEHVGQLLHTKFPKGLKPTQYTLHSTISDSNNDFNKSCGEVSLICYESKVEKPKRLTKSTVTMSIDELVEGILVRRRREYLARCKSAGTDTVEKPIYTEDNMKDVKQELKDNLVALREEYEDRLSQLISQLNEDDQDDVREYVNVATSPVFMWSEELPQREQCPPSDVLHNSYKSFNKMSDRSPKARRKKKLNSSQVWGQNLPDDFFERMQMFQEASSRHQSQLREKVQKENAYELEQRLASQHRIDTIPTTADLQSEDDICLPALFMPTKTRNIFTPKANAYFHMFGSYEGRLTQPPSIIQLPSLKSLGISSDILGVYKSKTNLTSGSAVQMSDDIIKGIDLNESRASADDLSSESVSLDNLDNCVNEDALIEQEA